jgi:hypothetical protein
MAHNNRGSECCICCSCASVTVCSVQAGRLEEAAAMLQAADSAGIKVSSEVYESFMSVSLERKKYNTGIQGFR